MYSLRSFQCESVSEGDRFVNSLNIKIYHKGHLLQFKKNKLTQKKKMYFGNRGGIKEVAALGFYFLLDFISCFQHWKIIPCKEMVLEAVQDHKYIF